MHIYRLGDQPTNICTKASRSAAAVEAQPLRSILQRSQSCSLLYSTLPVPSQLQLARHDIASGLSPLFASRLPFRTEQNIEYPQKIVVCGDSVSDVQFQGPWCGYCQGLRRFFLSGFISMGMESYKSSFPFMKGNIMSLGSGLPSVDMKVCSLFVGWHICQFGDYPVNICTLLNSQPIYTCSRPDGN
jgi:hypothetical protein